LIIIIVVIKSHFDFGHTDTYVENFLHSKIVCPGWFVVLYKFVS